MILCIIIKIDLLKDYNNWKTGDIIIPTYGDGDKKTCNKKISLNFLN